LSSFIRTRQDIWPFNNKAHLNAFKVHIEENSLSRSAVFSKLTDANICIFGGNGFVGKWLQIATKLLAEEFRYKVTVVVNRNCDFKIPDFRYMTINDPEFSWEQFDVIFHLGNAHENLDNINLESTFTIRTLRDILKKSYDSRIVFASSGAVYQKSHFEKNGNFKESTFSPGNLLQMPAISSYAKIKQYAEFLLNASEHTNFISARIFNVYGPFLPLDSNFAIGNFIRDALSKKSININGSGKDLRDFLFGLDLAIDLLDLAVNEYKGALNLGSGQVRSILEAANAINGNNPYEPLVGEPSADVRDYYPNLVLMNRVIGPRKLINFPQGIRIWLESFNK
jgi:nucleoside-diphosphate-sugar epimerase